MRSHKVSIKPMSFLNLLISIGNIIYKWYIVIYKYLLARNIKVPV